MIVVRRFFCPSCSEVCRSSDALVLCDACGTTMAPIDECLHVSVPDKPGELAGFLRALAERNVNVTALRVIARRSGEAHVLFSVDDVKAALELPGVQRAEEVARLSDVACID